MPLDCRKTYTKVDWLVWCGALTGRRDDLEFMCEGIARFLDETPDRLAFSDWYMADSGLFRGFIARSVVGGVYMPALFRDDLGRLIQTKKDAWIDNAEVSVVSGKVMYDCFGRTVEQRAPFIESLDKYKKPNYHASPDTVTTTGYDILDRVTKVVLPTGDSTITEHLFEGLPGSNGLFFKTYTTDALGNHTSQYTDCKGDVRAVKAGSQATTTFLRSKI